MELASPPPQSGVHQAPGQQGRAMGPWTGDPAEGTAPDGAPLQRSQQRLSLSFEKEEGEEGKKYKEKQNPKCQRDFNGMKFLHHLENIWEETKQETTISQCHFL